MSTLVTPSGVLQLGTLNPLVNQQIVQAVGNVAAGAAAALASAGAASTSAAAAAASAANPQIASASTAGAVKVGANLAVAPDGTVSTGVNSQQLRRFRIARAKTLSGQGNTRVLCLGDSTTFGVGSTNQVSEPNNNVWRQSWPQLLALQLGAQGIPASCHGIVCSNPGNSWNLATSDSRVSFGGGWSQLTTPSMGGGIIQASGAGGTLNFTPAKNVDSFRVWHIQNTGLGTYGLAVNSGTVTTQSTSGTTGYASSAIKTATLGANTLNISEPGGGLLFLDAIEAWDSTVSQFTITNAGWPGGKLADISSGPTGFGPLAAALAFAPDLYVVCIGINDWNNATPLATFTAALTPFLTALQAKADVVLVSPAPSSVGNTGVSNATQQGFVQAMHDAAQSLGIPFVDNWTRFGNWDQITQMYAPGTTGFIHPNMLGYAEFALPVTRVLATA